jgi:hypothetical protein
MGGVGVGGSWWWRKVIGWVERDYIILGGGGFVVLGK